MSLFDNNTSPEILEKEGDELIRNIYKISNSGNTLIPKDNIKIHRDPWTGITRTSKPTTATTFKEENSIFKSLFGADQIGSEIYNKYITTIRSMDLKVIVYNKKRYYKVNREAKKIIKRSITSC